MVASSLPHHSPSSSLPFFTTSLLHHFPSSPLPFLTTSLHHHFPSSPLPFVTTSLPHTSLPHHFPSSPLPFIITSLLHHFPSSPLHFIITSLPYHFPSSPLPFLTTSLPWTVAPKAPASKVVFQTAGLSSISMMQGSFHNWERCGFSIKKYLESLIWRRANWHASFHKRKFIFLQLLQQIKPLAVVEVHIEKVPKSTVQSHEQKPRFELLRGLDDFSSNMWILQVLLWTMLNIKWLKRVGSTKRCQSLVEASQRLKPMSGKCWSPPHRSAQHASKNVVAVDASQSKASSSSGCAIGMLLAWSSCYHPFRWLNSQPKGETSTSLFDCFYRFHASKNDMSNITEISKKPIQLGTFHLVAEFW